MSHKARRKQVEQGLEAPLYTPASVLTNTSNSFEQQCMEQNISAEVETSFLDAAANDTVISTPSAATMNEATIIGPPPGADAEYSRKPREGENWCSPDYLDRINAEPHERAGCPTSNHFKKNNSWVESVGKEAVCQTAKLGALTGNPIAKGINLVCKAYDATEGAKEDKKPSSPSIISRRNHDPK